MIAGGRHEARERALSLLYEAESKGVNPSAVLHDLPVDPDLFAQQLIHGVEADRERIDSLIGKHAIDWTVERMPVIDRNVLRLAVFEMLHEPATPVGVVISEAVALAKRYSSEESGRFVNGLLAAVAAELRPE